MDQNSLETPDWLFMAIGQLVKTTFTCDVAASQSNAKTLLFFSEERSGLEAHWDSLDVWCNPPYSPGNIKKWVKKAIAEKAKASSITLLLPASVGSSWFHEMIAEGFDAYLIKGRIKFCMSGNETKNGGTFDSVVLHRKKKSRKKSGTIKIVDLGGKNV